MYERTLYIRRKCGWIDKGDEVGVRTSKHERAMQDDDRQAGSREKTRRAPEYGRERVE